MFNPIEEKSGGTGNRTRSACSIRIHNGLSQGYFVSGISYALKNGFSSDIWSWYTLPNMFAPSRYVEDTMSLWEHNMLQFHYNAIFTTVFYLNDFTYHLPGHSCPEHGLVSCFRPTQGLLAKYFFWQFVFWRRSVNLPQELLLSSLIQTRCLSWLPSPQITGHVPQVPHGVQRLPSVNV